MVDSTEEKEKEKVEVNVRSLDGQQVHVKVPSDLSVAELKLHLQHLQWPAPGITQFHLFLQVSGYECTEQTPGLSDAR